MSSGITYDWFSETEGRRAMNRRGEVTLFGPPAASNRRFRGYSTGLNQYVTWTVNTLTPASNQTTPNWTGTLIDAHLEVP